MLYFYKNIRYIFDSPASEYRAREPRSRFDRAHGNGALHPLGPEQRRTAEAIKLSTNEDAGDFYNVRESLLSARAPIFFLLLFFSSLLSLSLSLSFAGFLFLVGPTDFFFYALLISAARPSNCPSNGVAGPGPKFSRRPSRIFDARRTFSMNLHRSRELRRNNDFCTKCAFIPKSAAPDEFINPNSRGTLIRWSK